MSNFNHKWAKTDAPRPPVRVKEAARPPGPLNPRLEQASRQIQTQTTKLDTAFNRLKEKDAHLFNRVVQALRRHDTQLSLALSNELAEVRKIAKMVSQAK